MTTPGGGHFTVTPHDVLVAAQSTNTTAENIAQELAALKNYVTLLAEEYKGGTAAQFTTLMAEFDRYATMLHHALTGIGSGLHTTYANYTRGEEQNLVNLRSVSDAMPSGNFT
jgi:WXG100 family type VII secretion target